MDQRRCSYTNISALKFFAVPQPPAMIREEKQRMKEEEQRVKDEKSARKKVCRSTCLEFLQPTPLYKCRRMALQESRNGAGQYAEQSGIRMEERSVLEQR